MLNVYGRREVRLDTQTSKNKKRKGRQPARNLPVGWNTAKHLSVPYEPVFVFASCIDPLIVYPCISTIKPIESGQALNEGSVSKKSFPYPEQLNVCLIPSFVGSKLHNGSA